MSSDVMKRNLGRGLTTPVVVALFALIAHSAVTRPNHAVQRDIDVVVFSHALGLFHIWAFLALIIFVLNVITGEVSWVDRLWSVLPPAAAWIITLKKLPVLPSQPGIRPDYLRDLRHSTLTDLPLNKRNPYLVGLQLCVRALRDVIVDPITSADRVTNGFHARLEEAPLLAIIVAVLLTLWGSRLSYNFWRKGGYWLGGEDYRWIRVRQWCGISSHLNETSSPCLFGDAVCGRFFGAWIVFPLFNVIFICGFQIWLLVVGLTSPLLYRLLTHPAILPSDVGLILLFLLLLLIETLADQQQWDFHERKKKQKVEASQNSSKDVAQYDALADETVGFLRSGLFRFSRHPNFAAEISMWWVIYSLTVVGAPISSPHYNASISGALALSGIFLGSTPLTEALSTEKYGDFYREYRRRVSMLLPFST